MAAYLQLAKLKAKIHWAKSHHASCNSIKIQLVFKAIKHESTGCEHLPTFRSHLERRRETRLEVRLEGNRHLCPIHQNFGLNFEFNDNNSNSTSPLPLAVNVHLGGTNGGSLTTLVFLECLHPTVSSLKTNGSLMDSWKSSPENSVQGILILKPSVI